MSMVWPTLGSSTAKEQNRITVSLMSVCVCVTVPTLVEMLKDIESPYEVSLLPYLHYTSIRMARVVSVLDSGAEGPGFKLQAVLEKRPLNRCSGSIDIDIELYYWLGL